MKKYNIELIENEKEFLSNVIESIIDRDYDEGCFEKKELKMLSNILEKVSGKRFEVEFWK